MGVSYPTKARAKDSAPDHDIEANIHQTRIRGKDCSSLEDISLQEINEDSGEEAGRRLIIWVPILCAAVLVVIAILAWGLHELFKPSS